MKDWNEAAKSSLENAQKNMIYAGRAFRHENKIEYMEKVEHIIAATAVLMLDLEEGCVSENS